MIHMITLLLSKITLFAASSQTIGEACGGTGFFGLKPWYSYLPQSDLSGSPKPGSCEIKHFHFLGNDIALVLLAVVDDLLRIAGMVAVGFVIYGAIKYIASQGNPEQTAQAQSTIVNALIGVAVAITAVAFVSYLGNQLGGS